MGRTNHLLTGMILQAMGPKKPGPKRLLENGGVIFHPSDPPWFLDKFLEDKIFMTSYGVTFYPWKSPLHQTIRDWQFCPPKKVLQHTRISFLKNCQVIQWPWPFSSPNVGGHLSNLSKKVTFSPSQKGHVRRIVSWSFFQEPHSTVAMLLHPHVSSQLPGAVLVFFFGGAVLENSWPFLGKPLGGKLQTAHHGGRDLGKFWG